MRLRRKQEHERKGAVVLPPHERASEASQARIIAELKKGMERLRLENEELKRQVKALSAQVYERVCAGGVMGTKNRRWVMAMRGW